MANDGERKVYINYGQTYSDGLEGDVDQFCDGHHSRVEALRIAQTLLAQIQTTEPLEETFAQTYRKFMAECRTLADRKSVV
jgi:hypothetical protein